jgi:hypothetical protein
MSAMKLLVRVGLVLGITSVCVFTVIWTALRPPVPLRPVATSFTLHDVTVVDPRSSRLEHQTLRVDSDRVHLELPGVAAASDAVTERYRGAFVLPGLVDMHAHLPLGGPLDLVNSYVLLLNLAYGVTSLREVGDIDGSAVPAQRTASRAGYPAPRVFACGPFVSAGKRIWPNTILLKGAEEAEAIVSNLAASGSCCVKAYDGLTSSMLAALRTATVKHHINLIGHVPEALRYEQALIPDVQHLMGVVTVSRERGLRFLFSDGWNEVDEDRLRDIVRVTIEHGIENTPTLVTGEQILLLEHYQEAKQTPVAALLPRFYRDVVWNPELGAARWFGTPENFAELRVAQSKKRALVRLLYEAGARLYVGTDTGVAFVVPGESVQREMQLFEQSGVPLPAIWRMATSQAGESLGTPLLGSIANGAPADLLIFRTDPTGDLRALDSLEAVVAGGRLYPKAAIDAKLAEYQVHFHNVIFDWVTVALARVALRAAIERRD